MAKRDAVAVPALPSLDAHRKQPVSSPRKHALRLALSARGARKECCAGEGQRSGAQTERTSNEQQKEGSHVEAFYKTRYCRYYTQQGNCWKGVDCQFAHSEAELRTAPDLTKTRMCAMFRLGYCKLAASECSFAHSLGDLKATDNFYKTEICSFWANGFCRAGEACRHAHGDAELRPRVQLACMKSRRISEYKNNGPADATPADKSRASTSTESQPRVPTTTTTAMPAVAPRNKMLNSESTCSVETGCFTLGSASDDSLSCVDRSHAGGSKAVDSPATTAASRRSTSSLGARTPDCGSCYEDLQPVSAPAAPVASPAVFIPNPFPCFVPAPWLYTMPAALPPPVATHSRHFVGIPLDNAHENEDLDREGFCVGVPSYLPQHVAMGFPLGGSPSPAGFSASWGYPTAPFGLPTYEPAPSAGFSVC